MNENDKRELERLKEFEARVRFLMDHADEVAYMGMAWEHSLTIMPLSDHRARIMGYWQQEADQRASPFRYALKALLEGEEI